MPFKKISLILSDTKDSFGNNLYNYFQLLIGCSYGFDPNTKFWRPLLKHM